VLVGVDVIIRGCVSTGVEGVGNGSIVSVGVLVGISVGVLVNVGVSVGTSVLVAVGVLVDVSVLVAVQVAVSVGVSVGVLVLVGVAVAVSVGVSVGGQSIPELTAFGIAVNEASAQANSIMIANKSNLFISPFLRTPSDVSG
jgi:hypothetical protein